MSLNIADSHHYQTQALAVLQANGFRLTQPRRQILACLAQTRVPLSAYEIRDTLAAQGVKTDIVTVYRVLECLEQNQVLHRMLTTGKVVPCHLPQEAACTHTHAAHHCHHLLSCCQCGTVQEIHCHQMDEVIAYVEAQRQFAIDEH